MKVLIKNAAIIPMTGSEEVIKEGYICIEEDKIESIGLEYPDKFIPDMVLEGKNKLVLPGLINTHTHIPMTLLRSYADDLPLEKWLFEKIFPIEDQFTAEDIYWASMLGLTEMIGSGTTCFADMYFFMDQIGKAVEEAGIRADLSRGLQCFDESFDEQKDKRLHESRQFYKDWNNRAEGRIKVRLGPHSVYTCIPQYLKSTLRLAEELGTGIHIHLSETQKENEECLKKYGKTPTQHLNDLGILRPNTIAAHCVHITEKDMDLLQKNKVSVLHNPGSNLKLGSGIAPIKKLMNKKINIALGTDSASSNNNLDMLQEVYLAAVLSKGAEEDPTLVKAYDALEMATVNGAKALGIDHMTGKLERGMKADLILVSMNKPHFYPLHDRLSNLVYSGQSGDVDMVMVDGKILYEKGQFKTIDYEQVVFNINRICQRLF
jgi:5-methylthioadenosine/S-adenosylhomocysteine deaminase